MIEGFAEENAGNTSYKPEISVIIPNLDGINYLPKCLSSLQSQTFKKFDVIIVDNGSTDNSVDLVKKEYNWVRLIELSENFGFSAACNTGIMASRGRYVAVLNNDTEVVPQWLEELHRSIERDKKIGMVASKILLSLETREIDSAGMLIYPDGIGRQRGRGEIDKGQFDHEEETLFPHGCAAMYRMEMLKEVGLFDEDFFAYCEDTDLGLRGRLAGWKAVVAPGAVVHHKYSATAGKYSSFKAMYIERNRFWVAVKNFPLTWLLRMPFYTLTRYSVQLYGVLTGRGSTARFKETYSTKNIILTVVKAYASAFRGLPLMLKKRKKIKKKISGKEFACILRKYKISASELILKD
ncbi:MAG TPA: glycosyltransferase family 2 protein [Nitrospirae bacterium]|nr:glycosyltransferase family 2 protein [Nitrospirota bacterium]